MNVNEYVIEYFKRGFEIKNEGFAVRYVHHKNDLAELLDPEDLNNLEILEKKYKNNNKTVFKIRKNNNIKEEKLNSILNLISNSKEYDNVEIVIGYDFIACHYSSKAKQLFFINDGISQKNPNCLKKEVRKISKKIFAKNKDEDESIFIRTYKEYIGKYYKN